MRRYVRATVLLALLVGPVLLYVVLGALWLAEHRGPFGFRGELLAYATFMWVTCGVATAYFASRWTRSEQSILPPIDWDQPRTFTEFDRRAWTLVEEAAELGEALPLESLTRFDTFVDSGRSLARRLAAHYNPLSNDPIEHVPVVELLTALQLAAEDLSRLCRDVPGGDLITAAHWKKAVQAAGYVQRASDLYTLLLPLFQPVAGIARLGAQKFMVQPAWKNMQQNVMRWFFRAYINRLGTHLIELYSGRLVIGSDRYRRLTRRMDAWRQTTDDGADHPAPLVIAVAGGLGAGKSGFIAALERAKATDLGRVRARLAEAGFDPELAEQFRTASIREVPAYPASAVDAKKGREARAWDAAVSRASEVDLLVLALDLTRPGSAADAHFLDLWSKWYEQNPALDRPPVLVVGTHADGVPIDDPWSPPYNWVTGTRPRERAVRAQADSMRETLGPIVSDVIPVALTPEGAVGITEHVLPELSLLLHRAERASLLRHLHDHSTRSKARRLLGQVGRQGRRVWGNLWTPSPTKETKEADQIVGSRS